MISNVVAFYYFSSICSHFIGLCVLGEVIGVLLMVALPLKPKPDPACRSESACSLMTYKKITLFRSTFIHEIMFIIRKQAKSLQAGSHIFQ